MSRIWFSKGLRGMTARRIQTDLRNLGFSAGPPDKFVDGDFGGFTETALAALQTQNGLPNHGAVDENTWGLLTEDPLPTLFERCLGLTAAFEGHGFTLLQGNFDGAGLTWGLIGFTLKSGEIQSLLRDAEAQQPGTLNRTLGVLTAEWMAIVQLPMADQLAFGDSLSRPDRKEVVRADWKAAFERLGNEAHVKRLQMDRAHHKYFVRAAASAQRLNLVSELGVALAFDVHVQNGGFKSAAFELAAQLGDTVSEAELRLRLADQVANSALPEWRDDVRKRKQTIASGVGSVHQHQFRLAAWGLDDVLAA